MGTEDNYSGSNGYKQIRSPLLLGKILGKHESTIRRELKRGMAEHLKTNLGTLWEYCTERAQSDVDERGTAKCLDLKRGHDWALVKRVTRLVRDEGHSPYAIIAGFNNTRWLCKTRFCVKTLYNYMQAGHLGDLTEKDLLYRGERRRSKRTTTRHTIHITQK